VGISLSVEDIDLNEYISIFLKNVTDEVGYAGDEAEM
jgi:hypothetical protein